MVMGVMPTVGVGILGLGVEMSPPIGLGVPDIGEVGDCGVGVRLLSGGVAGVGVGMAGSVGLIATPADGAGEPDTPVSIAVSLNPGSDNGDVIVSRASPPATLSGRL